jgi:hypothetical protein
LKDYTRRRDRENSYFPRPIDLVNELASRLNKDTFIRGELDPDKYLQRILYRHSSIEQIIRDIEVIVAEKLLNLKKDLE